MKQFIPRRILVLLLAAAIFVLLPVCGASAFKIDSMPSFSLPDVVTGDTVDSNVFDGKTLLVTFFATWCPPCIQEIPDLISLQNEYEKKGFSVVALSVDQGGMGVVRKLVEKRSINYPVLLANGATARDFGGVGGIPTSFLFDSKGLMVKKYPGYVPHVILENAIKRAMN